MIKKKVLAATGNAHKIVEMSSILAPHGIELISLKDLDDVPPEVVEDADTFNGNACKKALEIAAFTGMSCVADDSGLEVFSIGSAPGVYSARYAGENATDRDNLEKLLDVLGDSKERAARFVCCIALATPEGLIGTAEGEVPGQIICDPRGDAGFGYDPIFLPDGYEKTFAQLGSDIKDSISHRATALGNALKDGLFDKL